MLQNWPAVAELFFFFLRSLSSKHKKRTAFFSKLLLLELQLVDLHLPVDQLVHKGHHI